MRQHERWSITGSIDIEFNPVDQHGLAFPTTGAHIGRGGASPMKRFTKASYAVRRNHEQIVI